MSPQVVASERGTAQTDYVVMHSRGYRTAIFGINFNWNPLERGIIEGDNPVCDSESFASLCTFQESGCLGVQPKVGGKFHLKLNNGKRPIANKYREGKMQRTLKRELKSA